MPQPIEEIMTLIAIKPRISVEEVEQIFNLPGRSTRNIIDFLLKFDFVRMVEGRYLVINRYLCSSGSQEEMECLPEDAPLFSAILACLVGFIAMAPGGPMRFLQGIVGEKDASSIAILASLVGIAFVLLHTRGLPSEKDEVKTALQ